MTKRSLDQSRRMFARAKESIAAGLDSDIRLDELPFPLFFDHGRGSRIYDVDGNEYIDYVMAYGPLIMGHSPAPVIEAVKGQLDRGLLYAAQHEPEFLAAALCQVGHHFLIHSVNMRVGSIGYFNASLYLELAKLD